MKDFFPSLLRGRLFLGCSPRKCGRGISDAVITRDEARRIRRYTHLRASVLNKWEGEAGAGSRELLLKG